MRQSVAMAAQTARGLRTHLLRGDGQEDVTLAIYRPSTGTDRFSALIRAVYPPRPGERQVHGNASFTGKYVLRVAAAAAQERAGVVILHSHPGGAGWQRMSGPDADAERSYAYLAHRMTGLPLVGMTLAGGDGQWSARVWEPSGEATLCESVRVVDEILRVSWNEALRPAPRFRASQLRTMSAWGPRTQADMARLHVLVVGAGSVGLEVALRLVASGFEHVGVMDFDSVDLVNLDRLIGATRLDALLRTPKAEVAHRLMQRAATAENPVIPLFDVSICEPAGMSLALDYDVVFSCVDRPWARTVLNMLAYADLIPVVDGGVHIDPFRDEGMRNATWRSHVIRPGRPCLACNHQLDLGLVSADREGLLDDTEYIRRAAGLPRLARQNVAMLSVGVVSSVLSQFISLTVGPGGRGDPGPIQYLLSTHDLLHRPYVSQPNCYFEGSIAAGDQRLDLTGVHAAAEAERARRRQERPGTRVIRLLNTAVVRASGALDRYAGGRLTH
jgi:hypothetical protein